MTPRPEGEESCWIISVSCESFCCYANDIMNLQLTLIWDNFLFSTFLYKTRKRVITSKWKCLAIKTENWQTEKHGLIIVSISQTTLSVQLACWSTSSFLIVSSFVLLVCSMTSAKFNFTFKFHLFSLLSCFLSFLAPSLLFDKPSKLFVAFE